MEGKSLKTLEFDKIMNIISDFAGSEYGKTCIKTAQPFDSQLEIKLALDKLDDTMKLIGQVGNLYFGGLVDYTDYVKRASIGGILGISSLYDILHALKLASDLKNISIEANKAGELIKLITIDQNLLKDLDKAIVDRENLSNNASPLLRSLNRKKIQKTEEANEKLKSFVNSKANEKYLQDALITVREGRYVVPVKREYKGMISGITHDVSSSGGTYFIEPQSIVNINNEIREIEIQIDEEINRILKDFSNRIGRAKDELTYNFELMTELDILHAKAQYAIEHGHTKPIFTEDGSVDIRQMFHPLIDPEVVVKTDIEMDSDLKVLVITGPNTGGKTVVLKTVGIISLLAQSGCFIPALEGSKIPIYKNIYTDIGDEQSIEQSLSTFSSHMVNIVNILSSKEENSLYLFDELGAGTDPTEGAALAMSIIDSLREKDVKVLATTHYAELKLYALSTDGVVNGSMEFDVGSLKPTYRLNIGLPGRSNAFEISKKLGLADEYIIKAEEYISENNLEFENVLAEIEKNKVYAETQKAEYESKLKEFEDRERKNKEEIEKLKEKARKELYKANEEAREIYQKAKRDYEEIIKDANKLVHSIDNNSAREIQETRTHIRKNIDKLQSDNKKRLPKSNVSAEDVKIGSTVKIISIDKVGQVVDLPNENGDLIVQVGILKVNSNLKDIYLMDAKPQKERKKSSFRNTKAMDIKTEIDLRGVDTEELYDRVDKYLDDCVMSGLKEATIVHGKGTGALRKATHDLLKNHPHVKSYRLGEVGEGDTGVTVVTLK